MSPAAESWLLAFPYLITTVMFLLLAWAAGGWAYALVARKVISDPHPWYYNVAGTGFVFLLIRIAAGFALFSWSATVLGVTGHFQRVPLLSVIALLILSGWYMGHRFAAAHRLFLVKDALWLARDWTRLTGSSHAIVGFIGLCAVAVTVNAIIGALVPDMNHDTMWYHLSLPQQWTFSGRYDVLPSSLHSVITLAGESLYAIILLVNGDIVMCTLLVTFSGLAALAMLCCAAWAIATGDTDYRTEAVNPLWAPTAALGICVPLLALYGLMSPVQTKNDMIMYLWAACGALPLVIPVLGAGRVPAAGWWAVGGFVMGTAVCAKVSALPMVAGSVLVVAVCSFRRGGVSALAGRLALCAASALLAMAPWLYRGWSTTGVPLYPLGMRWFPMREQYVHIHENWSSIQGVGGAGGLLDALVRFAALLRLGATNGEKFIFVYLLVVAAALVVEKGQWRWLAIVLALLLAMPIGIKGGVEILRLFSPACILASLLVVRLMLRLMAAVSENKGQWYVLLVSAMSFLCFMEKQVRNARFQTMQWEYRPILSDKDVYWYSGIAEKGFSYRELGSLRHHIPTTARVLLLGYTYPYFLHRDTLWNDESISKGGVTEYWKSLDAEQVAQFLRRERIDVIVINRTAALMNGSTSELRAAEAGVITRVPLSAELENEGWEMYRPQGAATE